MAAYAVAVGRNPGIYNTWDECKSQVFGIAAARYKKFKSVEEAREFMSMNPNRSINEPMPPGNAGAPWTPEQDAWLWDAIATKDSEWCANKMARTRGAIEKRLMLIIQKRGYTPELLAHAKIDRCAYDDFIAKLAATASAKPNNKTPARPAKMLQADLNPIQKSALEYAMAGRSFFMTGSAGTGKSVTLHAIISAMKKAGKKIAVTAMTGCAALLIGGRTLHSALGLGIGALSAGKLGLRNAKRYCEYIVSLDCIIVDEVSMMDSELMDLVNEYLQFYRTGEPFGGVQMIFCGDFAQLPPVQGNFAFHSKAWKALDPKVVMLEHNYRQDKDSAFQDLLSRARWGEIAPEDIVALRQASKRPEAWPADMEPTRLYALNKDVARINAERMNAIEGQRFVYTTTYRKGQQSRERLERWATACGIPNAIELCVGAQVMVMCNIDPMQGLVNGARGVVRALSENYVVLGRPRGPDVTIGFFEAGPEESDYKPAGQPGVCFMPLKLAFAVSIHKSQGMTLDAVEMDIGRNIFEFGQAYVALSRARNLENCHIVDVAPQAFKCHPDVLKFYKRATAITN